MSQIINLDAATLKKYARISEADRKLRPASDPEYIKEVMDYYLNGANLSGIKLPDCLGGDSLFKEKFRLAPGETSVVCGINGSGKSLLANMLVLSAGSQNYRCLIISPEMSPRASISRMIRQSSLQSSPTLDAALDWAKWSDERIWLYDQYGSVNPGTIYAVMQYAVHEKLIDLVVIDSLMTVGGVASDDWNGQKDFMCGIANAARGLNIHVVLITHARKSGSDTDRLTRWSISGSADISNRADNIFLLGRTFEQDPHQPDAYLHLCKARNFDGAEMELDLWLDHASMNYHRDSELPSQIGMGDNVKPIGGVVGRLHDAGLKA